MSYGWLPEPTQTIGLSERDEQGGQIQISPRYLMAPTVMPSMICSERKT